MPPHRAAVSTGSRVADVLHKAFITGLAAFTIYGAVEVTSEVNFLNRRRAERRATYAAAAANGNSSDDHSAGASSQQ